ncbi:hypothetical protein D3C81_725040 [compost metagenome]
MLQRLTSDFNRAVAFRQRKDWHFDLLAEYLQLLDRRGTVNVTRYEQRPMILFQQQFGQLGRGRRLTGPLQACHHDDRWRPITAG